MSDVWASLKNSLNCKPHSTEVHEPVASGSSHHRSGHRKKQGKIESSKTKDVTHDGKNIGHNNVTHEIVNDSKSGEIKLCLCCPCPPGNEDGKGVEGSNNRSRKTQYVDCHECNVFSSKPRVSMQKGSSGDPPTSTCNRECGDEENCAKEQGMLLENSVIQLYQEDSSWQIIEKICQPSYPNSESRAPQMQCVLKVINTPNTFASFEEYKQTIMTNAEKLQHRHPRCLADGNELMRFYGTTIACPLGVNDSSTLCNLDQCSVCHILRHGFNTNQEFNGAVGVVTNSTSGQAFDSISVVSSDETIMRKCVVVCRVVAGRAHNPLHEIQDINDSGFDSLVRKVSSESDIEELFVLNPRAILPCFVVIYKS